MYQQPPAHSNNASPHRGLHNGYSNFPVPQTGSPHATNFAPQPYSLQHKSPYSPSTQSHHDLHSRPCMPHPAGAPHPNISMSNPTPMQASTHTGFTQPQNLMPNSAYHQPNPVSTAPPSFALKNNNNNHSLPHTPPMFYNNPSTSGYPMQNNPYQRMPQYPNQAPISQPPTWDNTTHNIHHHQRSANHLQSPKSDMSNSPTSNSSTDSKSSRANRSFTCPKCAKVFKRGDHLKRHLLSVHDREHPYQCGECSKGFASISTLLRHRQTSHSGMTTKGHLCVRCNIRIVNLQEFENHATSLHEAQDLEYMKNINQCSRTYSCSLCNKTVSSEKNLKRHVKKLHGDVMEENTTSAVSTTSTAVASPSISTQSQPTVNTTIASALNPTAQQEPVQAHHQIETNFQMELPKAVPETFPFSAVPQITTTSQNVEHAVKPIKSESVHTVPAPHAVQEEKLTVVTSYTANQKEIENKKPENIIQNSVTDTTQAIHSQQYFASSASNTSQSAAPVVYSEPNTVSEAFSMAMKALSDFSYDDLSFSSTDYLSAGPSVFQSNSPLPNFHYPSRARMQTDQVDSRDYYQASSVQLETGAAYPGQAVAYPEVKVFSAPVCHDITVTPTLQPDVLNADKSHDNGSFQVKRGRPKKKRRRDEEEEDDDQGHGMITKDPASENLSYNCTVCSEVYEGIDKLMQHVEAVHLSLNPHECCICNKRFAQAGNVKRHIRFVHLRERPFRCRECDSTFDRLCYLQRHMRAHIDSKADSPVASQLNPCNCPECGKRCLTTHHLRGHMQRKHFAKNKNRSEDLRSKYGYLFNDLDQVNQGEKMGSKSYDQDESKKMLSKQNNEHGVHVVSNATLQQTPQQIINFSTVPLQPNLHNSEVQRHELHEDNSQLSMLLTANDDESHDISSKLNIKSNPLMSEVIGQGRSNLFKLDPPKKLTAVKINTKRKNRIKIYYGRAMIKKIKSRMQLRYKCHCCLHPGFPKIYLLKSHLAVAHHSATKCHICIGCGRSFSTSDSLLVHIRKQHRSKKIKSSVRSSRKQVKGNSKPHSVGQKGFSKIEALHMTNNMSVLGHFAYKEPQARFENIPQLSTHSLVHAEI
ncbi:zinc finger protein 38 isoform X2 [Ciona intestinalis]